MIRRLSPLVLLLALSASAQTVRIEVLGLFHSPELTVAPKSLPVVLDLGTNIVVLDHGLARLHLSAEHVRVTVGSRSWDAEGVRVRARDGAPAEFVLAVPGKIHRAYRGVLEITAGGGELVPVVAMDLETAVASVVAAESPPGAPLEALKAQAVASRSILLARRSGHTGFDFCDTTHCQFLREPPAEDSAYAHAARLTRGLVLAYRDAPLAALYARSCGGRTRSLAELGLPVDAYPYYSVDCPYCRAHSPTWTRDLPQPPASERERLFLGREFGWSALPSNHYQVRRDGGRTLAEGSGQGHGLGLCQNGAAAMARDGRDFRQILAHYYPNTTVRALPAPAR